MLTAIGIKRKISLIRRLAEPGDKEVTDILQDAVKALNQLSIARSPECRSNSAQQVKKTGN